MNDITSMQLEVTTRCNFDCIFCSGRHMEQKHMDFELVKKAIDMFPHLKEIQMQGEGEPLLHPGFFELVKYAKKAGLYVLTTTNGSLLTDKKIMGLLDSGIDLVYVSIEAADDEMYKTIRRGGSYEKLISNVRRFVEMRNKNGYHSPVIGFAITVMRNTGNMFEKIINLYNELGLDAGVKYNCLIKVPFYTVNYGEELNNQAFSRAEEKLVYHENDQILIKNKVHRGPDPDYDNFSNCIWLDHRISINVNGSCLRCPFDKGDREFVYGNINTDSLEKIMETKEKLIKGEIPQPKTLDCTRCYIFR